MKNSTIIHRGIIRFLPFFGIRNNITAYLTRLVIFLIITFTAQYLQAQVHYMEKGGIKAGIQVILDGKSLAIDSLAENIQPGTQIPIGLTIPEGSVMRIVTDSLRNFENIQVYERKRKPALLSDLETQMRGFTTSSAAGAKRFYGFIDVTTNDTLRIDWEVGYNPVEMLDVLPGEYFERAMAYQISNVFEPYPDKSQFDWSTKGYIRNLNERGVPITPSFPSDENSLYFVTSKRYEAAEIQLVGYHTAPQPFDPENPFALYNYKDLEPGKYELVVYPYKGSPDTINLRYAFTILAPWWQTSAGLVGITLLSALVFGGLGFLFYRRRQQRKTQMLQWANQLTEAELTAIRAQLNPHFLFNALSSIQNLVNTQQNDRANEYITKLSRLLRKVLSTSDKQMHELDEELSLLKLYLELEKLRYGFAYRIEVDPSVDRQTLVPVMLLQPYAENAVKHGIAGMKEKGKIEILVHQKNGGLEIEILDNGGGLTDPEPGSKGLELGEERIKSLNELYSIKARVEVKNRKHENGVRAMITLPITDEL